MFVYDTGAAGLRNMAEFLEEIVSRVFGDFIAEGIMTKIADDLITGGNTIKELLENWFKLLLRCFENNLKLAASKTFICPKTINIIGWIWSGGTITVDSHRINPLITCSLPKKVKQLRSFIGAFRVVSRCIPQYGNFFVVLKT